MAWNKFEWVTAMSLKATEIQAREGGICVLCMQTIKIATVIKKQCIMILKIL